MKTTMGMIRTFHPVGQGAFYSEKFETKNGDTFTIVYDCGSTTLPKERLDCKIKTAFPKDSKIDILFISHFHADHINGIETLKKHCKIKTVVLPLLGYETKVLLKVAHYLDQKEEPSSRLPYDQFEKLIDDPASFFCENGTRIITIAPTKGNISFQKSSPVTIKVTQLPSGTALYPFQGVNWFFIPFNYQQDKCEDLFVRVIKEEDLSLKDIDTIDKIVIHEQILKKAYASIGGNLNKNSIILFSGGIDVHRFHNDRKPHSIRSIYFSQGNLHHENIQLNPDDLEYFPHRRSTGGCLYLGEINLNEGNLTEDIKSRLGDFLSSLGTIQVPHDSFKHDFDHFINKLGNIRSAILSIETKNRCSDLVGSVIAEIERKGIVAFLVTEDPKSIMEDHIDFQWNFR